MKRYLIVGDGVAGAWASVKIREMDSEGEVTLLTEEAYFFYYWVRFLELVAGDVEIKDLLIHI
jgi:hypothetical protein